MKICNTCGQNKELNQYYTQTKKKKDGSKWIYYNPRCKECTIEIAKIRQEANKEKT